MSRKPTPRQLEMLRAMIANGISFVSYYPGPPGAEGRGAGYFWRTRKEMPKPLANVVESCIARGYMTYAGDSDHELTKLGRHVAEHGSEP